VQAPAAGLTQKVLNLQSREDQNDTNVTCRLGVPTQGELAQFLVQRLVRAVGRLTWSNIQKTIAATHASKAGQMDLRLILRHIRANVNEAIWVDVKKIVKHSNDDLILMK